MGENISEIRRVKLRLMMKKALFTIGIQPRPPGFVGPQKPTGQPATPDGGEKWVLQKIVYFDPFYDKKNRVIGGPLEHANKKNYFRDIHMFVNRMKIMAIIKSDKLVNNNMYTCFKGKTFYWLNSVFPPKQKCLIKLEKKIEKWECHELV